MKQEQKPRLALVRETVVQRAISRLQQSDQPNAEEMVSGLAVRTDLKAGEVLLGLLLNNARQTQAADG